MDDRLAHQYLLQCVSVAVQRGNAASVLGCMGGQVEVGSLKSLTCILCNLFFFLYICSYLLCTLYMILYLYDQKDIAVTRMLQTLL